MLTDHYYSRHVEAESKPMYWEEDLRGHRLHFKTDQGVFSKKAVDFGSKLLVNLFEEPEIAGPILDVGCGYGPIGLTIAKSFPTRTIHMVDVNERALALAKENASNNKLTNAVIYESDRLQQVKEKNFTAIITNPPIRAGKKVVHDIFTQSYHHLTNEGSLWVVIQKKQGAPSAQQKLQEIFHSVEIFDKKKGYYILKAKKG